ncbi:hypothetical protein XELAEV_18003833mg [Xenopus laevis]|nr:hypothetical protein XELAEV_18003833mg [Xenopus laevis]
MLTRLWRAWVHSRAPLRPGPVTGPNTLGNSCCFDCGTPWHSLHRQFVSMGHILEPWRCADSLWQTTWPGGPLHDSPIRCSLQIKKQEPYEGALEEKEILLFLDPLQCCVLTTCS